MGNPSRDIMLEQDVYWRILRKQLHICGTWNSSYDGTLRSDWTDAVAALCQGDMNVENLISHRYSQDRLMEGLTLMRDKKTPYCKVMTVWNR